VAPAAWKRCSPCWRCTTRWSPPTINLFNQDPACDLDFCANTARMKIDYALKNSFGFGGTNGSLVFGKV
jgi:3-oxoacyl-[acyl-carrier-protein] synthase II